MNREDWLSQHMMLCLLPLSRPTSTDLQQCSRDSNESAGSKTKGVLHVPEYPLIAREREI